MAQRTVRYCSILILLLCLWPLASARIRAQAAQELVANLVNAARSGDSERFLSLLTADSRKAVVESFAGQAELRASLDAFRKALDAKFGAGSETLASPPDDLKTAMGRLAGAEVITQKRGADGSLDVEVKTQLKTEDARTLFRDETLVFRQERGTWRLALGLAPDGRFVSERKAAAAQVMKEIQEGRYKDRLSAMLALANAWSNVG